MTVTDTATNQSKTYSNPQGTPFQTIADTITFAACPAGAESLAISNPEEPGENMAALMAKGEPAIAPPVPPVAPGTETPPSVMTTVPVGTPPCGLVTVTE